MSRRCDRTAIEMIGANAICDMEPNLAPIYELALPVPGMVSAAIHTSSGVADRRDLPNASENGAACAFSS
jgi:hypothetical protein